MRKGLKKFVRFLAGRHARTVRHDMGPREMGGVTDVFR